MKDQRAVRAASLPIEPAQLAAGATGKRTLVDSASAAGMVPPAPARGGTSIVQAKTSATTTDQSSKPSHNLSAISKTAIEELDGDKSKKVLLATVLAAAKLQELPAFTAILKAAPMTAVVTHAC